MQLINTNVGVLFNKDILYLIKRLSVQSTSFVAGSQGDPERA